MIILRQLTKKISLPCIYALGLSLILSTFDFGLGQEPPTKESDASSNHRKYDLQRDQSAAFSNENDPETSLRQRLNMISELHFTHPLDVELGRAIERNDLQGIRDALQQGANVNATGRRNLTPLVWAVPYGKFERFELLLKLGADPNIQVHSLRCDGLAPYHMFTEDGANVVEWSAGTKFPKFFATTLKYGGDVRIYDSNKHSLLAGGMRWGGESPISATRPQLYQWFGGDLNIRSADWDSVLHDISGNAFESAVRLVEFGGDPLLRNAKGHDAFTFMVSQVKENDSNAEWRRRKLLAMTYEDAGGSIERALQWVKSLPPGPPLYPSPKPRRRHLDPNATDGVLEENRQLVMMMLSKVQPAELPPQKSFVLPADLKNVAAWSNRDRPRELSEAQFRKRYGMHDARYFQDPKTIELCLAIERNDLDRMSQLIESGVDVNAMGIAGMTPLMWAYPFQRIQRIRTLIDAGADPTTQLKKPSGVAGFSRPGWNVLSDAAMTATADVFDAIVTAMEGRGMSWTEHRNFNGDTIPLSILKGLPKDRLTKMKRYIDAGGDIDVRGPDGSTPLMNAMILRDTASIEFLLEHGADPHAKYEEVFNVFDFFVTSEYLGDYSLWFNSISVPDFKWQFDVHRVRALLRCFDVDEREYNKYGVRQSRKRDGISVRFDFDDLQLTDELPRWRSSWYPRQDFARCGERFADDLNDLRRYHSWNDYVPLAPHRSKIEKLRRIDTDTMAEKLIVELPWLAERVKEATARSDSRRSISTGGESR